MLMLHFAIVLRWPRWNDRPYKVQWWVNRYPILCNSSLCKNGVKLSHLTAMHYGIPVNICQLWVCFAAFCLSQYNSLISFTQAAAMWYNFSAQSSAFFSSDEMSRLFLGLLGMREFVILQKHSSKLLFISRKLRYIELCVKLHVCWQHKLWYFQEKMAVQAYLQVNCDNITLTCYTS